MVLERHTGASPETWPKYSSLEFAVTSPFYSLF
jgi:hypothetical protein